MKRTLQRKATQELSVAEKIYLLRKQNRTTQAVLAEAMRARPEKIVRVERGEDEYTQAQINAAKKHFDIVDLPLTERESIAFKERLYYWHSLLKARKLDEAKAIHNEMINIDSLKTCDYHMVTLCKMIAVYQILVEEDYICAEEKLSEHQDFLYKMNAENLYHYYKCKGFLCLHKGGYEEGLNLYLKAYDLLENCENIIPEDDERLYYNIAYCYSYLEFPYRAIFFFQKARHAQADNKNIDFFLNIDRSLALNYIKMNQLKEAERLLNRCSLKAESIKNSNSTNLVLLCFGYMYKKANNWPLAINHFDEAIKRFPNDSDNYYSSLYHKIQCVIHARAFSEAKHLLLQTKEFYSSNEMWVTYFTALGHYLKISSNMSTNTNSESVEYIENTAIPYLIKNNDYFLAIDYYTILENHYEKINSIKKSLLMAKAIRDIYLRCYTNHRRDD